MHCGPTPENNVGRDLGFLLPDEYDTVSDAYRAIADAWHDLRTRNIDPVGNMEPAEPAGVTT